jgi:4-aminobutyrate aminotransferase-like enzyme
MKGSAMSQATASRKTTAASEATTKSATTATVGEQLRQSPAIRAAIQSIVAEVRAKSAQITDVRGPVEGLRESYQAHMKRAAETRGRGLLYPCLGSGAGNGALVELMDGSVKWDMVTGIGVYFFGHSDPGMIEAALEGSIVDTNKHGNLQSGFEHYEFAETLLKEAAKGSRLKNAYVSTSGAMANENALKVCYQKHAPASRVIAFRDCFMGRSNTMAQIGDSAEGRVGLPLSVPVDYMPFFDEVAAEKIGLVRYIDGALGQLQEYITRYPKQHACFIFELVQGEGGFNVGNREFFKALIEMCKANSIAVWDDEIQTFGRLGEMFAYELFDLGQYVDVFCVGKMTQACVTMFTEEYNPKPGLLSGTFTGETVSFRVGQRVVERLRDGDYYGPKGSIARHHTAFRTQAKALMSKHPEWFPKVPELTDLVGGLGGMMRLTPFGGKKEHVTKACRAMFDEGVVLFHCGHGPYHVRMLPPLGVMLEKDWPRVFACVEKGLAKAAGEIKV